MTITSADYVWNEDDSGSWERYEDVVMFEVNFRDDDPQSMWPLLPAIHEALAYTIRRETEYSSSRSASRQNGCRKHTGEELTRDDFIKAELALQDAKLEAGIDLEKEKSPGLIGKYHDWKKNRVRHKVNKKKYLSASACFWAGAAATATMKAVCAGGLLHPVLLERGALLPLRDRPSSLHCHAADENGDILI